MISSENRALLKTIPLFDKIGFEFNDGWTNLIYTLGENITLYCDLHGIPLPKIQQIKEKFGTLRFYVNCDGNKTIRAFVNQAEEDSETICEECGELGTLICDDGCWKTVCPAHTPKNSITAEEFKTIQEARSKAMRKCDVCSSKGADPFYDPSIGVHTNRCHLHIEPYFIRHEEFWKQKGIQ